MTPQRAASRIKPKRPIPPRIPPDDVWTFAGKPMPIIYEDEGQDEMGEANLHTRSDFIITTGLITHLKPRGQYQVYSNLDCYYSPGDRAAYFSSDTMVVEPFAALPEDIASYRIGTDGPAPLLTIEILSQRSGQQRDRTDKPVIYGQLGVAEYILADLTGRFLPERLQLMRRLHRAWKTTQDADGGVTSKLGFRIIIDTDNQFRVVDAATGKGYLRPDEAQAAEAERQKEANARKRAEQARAKESKARQEAEEQIRQLSAELKRLRKTPPGP